MTAAHMAAAPRVFEPGPIPAAPSMQSRALAQVLNHSLRRIGEIARLNNRAHLRIVREAFDLVGYFPVPRGTRVHAINDDGVRGHWVAARNADEGAGALLYLHGGGFLFGGLRTHRHLVAALSAACGLPALLLDYRRAPEHRSRPPPTTRSPATGGCWTRASHLTRSSCSATRRAASSPRACWPT